jgi:hypothetical protein
MPTDSSPIETLALSPRATVAQLTLRLRASLEEAAAAEAGDANVNVDHDAAFARLQARLGLLIAARRRSLDEALALARAEASAEVEAAHRETSALVPEASASAEVMVVAPTETDPPVDGVRAVPMTTIVIDAEAFARVLATVLGEHLSSRDVPAHASPPAAAKRSFWAQARHVDVVLVALAAVIVLVILASWLA